MEKIPFKREIPHDDSRITKAAIVIGNDVYTDWRHFQILWGLKELAEHERLEIGNGIQGFVDQYGIFYNRGSAASIALRRGQIPERKRELLSEDVWEDDGTPVEYKKHEVHSPFTGNSLPVYRKVTEEDKKEEAKKTIGRNDPCYCGSGKKFKKCHGA